MRFLACRAIGLYMHAFMNLQVVDIISFLYLISGIVALFLSVFVFRSRQKGYQLTLAFLFLSGAWWSLSMFFENFSAGIQGHIFWNVVSYPAIMSAPVLLFLFLYEYTHHNKTVYWWLKTILFVVPLVSSFFVYQGLVLRSRNSTMLKLKS